MAHFQCLTRRRQSDAQIIPSDNNQQYRLFCQLLFIGFHSARLVEANISDEFI